MAQDKYQLALDAVVKQMNLLANNPLDDNLRLAHEQARQRFIQVSNMERDEYEKFLHSTLIPSTNAFHHRAHEDTIVNLEETYARQIYVCCFLSICLCILLSIVCILIWYNKQNSSLPIVNRLFHKTMK